MTLTREQIHRDLDAYLDFLEARAADGELRILLTGGKGRRVEFETREAGRPWRCTTIPQTDYSGDPVK